MNSVGTQIRTARLEAGVSLEEISARTCISQKILQAIEDDDFRQITSGFFYKSFVKQVCAHVGLPVEAMADAIAAAVSHFPEPIVPGQGEAIIRSSVIRPLKRPRRMRWLLPAASLAFVLVACSGFYAYWERLRVAAPPAFSAKSLLSEGSDRVRPQSPAIAEPQAAVPPEPDGGFRVELSAVERTWLSLRADGKQLYSGILEVDQTKTLEGHQEGLVRTGNAGGVRIVFNGKPIGLAGPHGSIRTVVFTKDNYEVLPDPVHPSLSYAPLPLPLTIGGWLRLPLAR